MFNVPTEFLTNILVEEALCYRGALKNSMNNKSCELDSNDNESSLIINNISNFRL